MVSDKFNLQSKTALITGASGLLGMQHAYALLQSGARVILTDIDSKSLSKSKEKLETTFDSSLIDTHVMDVTNLNDIQNISKYFLKKALRIDILINNASVDSKVKGTEGLLNSSRLENFSIDQWNLEIEVGLTGAFFCTQVFGSDMSKDGLGGVILNIASDLSVISPNQSLYQKDELDQDSQPVKPITYSVVKTGLIGLTRYVATYWADKGVRCNALSPGGVFTNQSDEFVKKISSLIPLNRMAKKNEYHSAIQFLCSDASLYLNGQNIVMDGGRSIW